jgi:hypothetical protein
VFRLTIVCVFGLAAGCAANAGQFQIGEIAGNTVGGANSGLTTNYVQGTASCAGAVYQGNTCASTSGQTLNTAGQFSYGNYDARLFAGAAPAPTPFTGYATGTGTAANSTLVNTKGTVGTSDDVTFEMVSAGLTGVNSNNYWNALGNNDLINIPIGIFGVSDVWTMLNNVWGPAGVSTTELVFTFDGASDGSIASSLTTITVDPFNSSNTAGGSGQIRAGVDCVSGTTTFCASYGNGPLASSSTLTGAVKVNNVAQSAINVSVLTNSLLPTTAYTSASGNYASTAGNLNLDAQGFSFGGLYANLYLVGISVRETGVGNNGVAGGNRLNASQTALSAITVDTFEAVPEPSTWLLFGTAFSAIGLGSIVRKRRSSV